MISLPDLGIAKNNFDCCFGTL